VNPELRRDFLICVALLALVVGVFGQAVTFGFVNHDDPLYVTDNEIVRKGLTDEGFRWALKSTGDGNWLPLTWLLHMTDSQIFGSRAGGHHLTSIIIHACNTIVLFLLLRTLTGQPWPSALVAALFAVHPLHVESVAWVAERKDVLSTLLFLLTLAAYARFARTGSVAAYVLTIFVFALALMSKAMVVTTPAVMLLLDVWPLKRKWSWRLLWEKIPFVAMSIGAAIATIIAQRSVGAVRTLEQFPLSFRITNAIVSYARYLAKTFWPFDLAVFYPAPPGWPIAMVLAAAVLLVVVTAIVILRGRSRPYLIVGWLWFLGTLLPVIGLLQVGRQSMADRYSYIPHIGLFIMIAWTIAQVRPPLRYAVAAVMGLVIAALAVRSFDQTRHWRDTQALFEHALAVTDRNAIAHLHVANVLARQNKILEADDHYRRAIEIDDKYALAHLNLAGLLARRHEFGDAVDHFRRSIELNPTVARAHLGLGLALAGMGRYGESEDAFREALRINPRLADVYVAWGETLEERGVFAAAEKRFREALAINPQHERARQELAALRKRAATTSTRPATRP
jgi:Tfp pilus assembly protein PilF